MTKHRLTLNQQLCYHLSMSKPLYDSIDKLKKRCDSYMKSTKLWSPKEFRVYIGVSKHLLSTWGSSNKEYFNLIKEYERKILARVEAFAIYGQAHPIIKENLVVAVPYKSYYADKYDNKGNLIAKGSVKVEKVEVHVTGKFNNIGAMFILKAYENELYNQPTPQLAIEERRDPIVIDPTNKSKINLDKLIKVKPKESK